MHYRAALPVGWASTVPFPFLITLHDVIIEILSGFKIDGRCIPQIMSITKNYMKSPTEFDSCSNLKVIG